MSVIDVSPTSPSQFGTHGDDANRGILRGVLHEVNKVALGVFQGVNLFFVKLGQIRMDVSAFGRVLGLCVFGFTAARLVTGSPLRYDISESLNRTKDMMDAGQALEGVNYFGSKGNKKTVTKSLGYGAMMAASVGVGVEILDKCKLLSLAKIGKGIGSIPLLGAVTKIGITFGQCLGGLAAFGWVCFAANAIERIVSANNGGDRRQAFLDLVWNVAEVAAAVFAVIASSCTVGVIALGVTAALLGITSYLHRLAVRENLPKAHEGLVLNNY